MKTYIVFLVVLSFCWSCSTLSKLAFWESDDDHEENKGSEVAENDSGNENEGKNADNEKSELEDEKTTSAQDKDSKTSAESKSKSSSKSERSSHERRKARPLSPEQIEQNQAELMAKMDEVQRQMSQQSQRMTVIEKALTLGIIPDELRNDAKSRSGSKPHKQGPKFGLSEAKDASENKIGEEKSTKKDAAATTNNSQSVYEQKMMAAQDFFRAGRYGRAIAEYSAIQKEMKEFDINGNASFWMAMSWMNMKEYQSAQKSFESFIGEYPNSPLLARASFYLARTELQLGLREKSVGRLKKIITDKPDDDAAEMARLELQQMKSTL